jgi:hypothetical protein
VSKAAKKVGCCERFKEKKGKACKGCPLMAGLGKKERRKVVEKWR